MILDDESECLVDGEVEGVIGLDAVPRHVNGKDVVDLGYPVRSDGKDLELPNKQTIEDPSLKHCRRLGNSNSQGYCWKNGLLFHRHCDEVLGVRERIVYPNPEESMS